MARALRLADGCAVSGDVPVGALVVGPDGAGEPAVLGEGHNAREESGDPTAHAEVLALRAAASRFGAWRLEGCTLVVTLEPCVMCAGAALAARVDTIVFGAFDEKAGACGSVWDVVRDRAALHHPQVYAGVMAAEAAAQLADFFADRR